MLHRPVDLAVFDLLAIGKGLLGFAAGFVAPSVKRRLAERGAGRSDREVDTGFLRLELAVTLDLIEGLEGDDAWWRDLLQTVQHDFITPDFLQGGSLQEWLQQGDVRSDLLTLAEERILGESTEDQRAVDRLSASYQARTGEVASLARGAIDLVIAMMLAGYRANLRSGGSHTGVAGLVQGAHRANLSGHAETQERLADLPAIRESITRVEVLLAQRHSDLRSQGRITALDLATAFATNTRAARVRPDIPGVGQIARPELPALLNAVAAAPTLLLGRGGAGKSGLVSLLIDELQAAGRSVLLLDASLLPRSATTPQDVGDSLVEPLTIQEAIMTVAHERPVTFIVDQLDTVAGTDRGNAVISLLRGATGIANVQVLAVSRTFHAERSSQISALGFQPLDADELTENQAREALSHLSLSNPPPRLILLARNLLELSLIASLVSKGVDVLQIAGEIALWEQYRLSLEREHPAALGRAIEIAWQAAEQGSHSIAPALISTVDGLAALQSRAVLDATPARLRLRHERIRDYLVAWDAARDNDPLSRLLGRLPREALLGALRWLHMLLHASDADLERDLVVTVLGNSALTFDVRAVVLEGLKLQTDPNKTVASALVPHLTHGGHAQLFYAELDGSWLALLARGGAFAETPSDSAAYWFPIDYLRAQANAQPEAVTQILERVHVGSPWIIGDILEVATRLPHALAARIAARMAVAIPDPRLRQIRTSRTAARLAATLARDGRVREALALVRALLEPFAAGQSPLTDRPQVRSPLDVHEARDCLRISLTALMDADSSATREAFEELFEQALSIDPEDDGALSYINRRAVEDNDQSDFGGSVGVLLVGLRDSAERWCRDQPDEVCGLLKRYVAHRHWLFRRLGVHLLRLNRQACESLVHEVQTDHALLSPNAAYHEVYLLLEAAYGDLPPAAQTSYLDWVERSVATMDLKDYPEALHHTRRLGRTRRLLWPIRAYLQGHWGQRLDAIVAEYGEESADLQGYLTGPVRATWGGDDTTETEERLRRLSLDELIDELLSADVRDDPFGPGAAATAFGHLVQEDPDRFGVAAQRFVRAGLHARFVSELLEGLTNAVRSDRPIPWEHVVAACQLVGARRAPSPDDSDEGEAVAWRDAQRAAIDLLALGLGTQAPTGLPHELGEAARDLLIALLAHPDPGPERDQVCITGENEQPFRKVANRDFGRSRTSISDEAEQSFRLMPNTHFG